MTSTSLYTGAALATLLLAALAAAQDYSQPRALEPEQEMVDAMSFDQLDANDDGHVELAELPAMHPLIEGFAKADLDNDGRLSREEFEQQH